MIHYSVCHLRETHSIIKDLLELGFKVDFHESSLTPSHIMLCFIPKCIHRNGISVIIMQYIHYNIISPDSEIDLMGFLIKSKKYFNLSGSNRHEIVSRIAELLEAI